MSMALVNEKKRKSIDRLGKEANNNGDGHTKILPLNQKNDHSSAKYKFCIKFKRHYIFFIYWLIT
jgi:hypothetical protein